MVGFRTKHKNWRQGRIFCWSEGGERGWRSKRSFVGRAQELSDFDVLYLVFREPSGIIFVHRQRRRLLLILKMGLRLRFAISMTWLHAHVSQCPVIPECLPACRSAIMNATWKGGRMNHTLLLHTWSRRPAVANSCLGRRRSDVWFQACAW